MEQIITTNLNPKHLYVQSSYDGGTCEIKNAFVILGDGNNQTVLAGVDGKQIYVLEGNVNSTAVAARIIFKNNTTWIKGFQISRHDGDTPNVQFGGHDYPIMRTGTGLPLMADVAASTSTVWISLTYILVTP